MYKANLFLDFDDVVNIEGWLKPKYRHRRAPLEDRLGETRSASVPNGGFSYRICWFEGVVDYFRLLQEQGVNVRWLSTWEAETSKLAAPLGWHAGYIPWDTYIRKAISVKDIENGRNARKLAAVKEVTEQEGLPFVWVDDTATTLWNPADFEVPSLGLVIRRITGFDRLDAERIDSFLGNL